MKKGLRCMLIKIRRLLNLPIVDWLDCNGVSRNKRVLDLLVLLDENSDFSCTKMMILLK